MLVSKMNFKRCPDGFSVLRLELSSFPVAVSFQFRFVCHHFNALRRCFKAMSMACWYQVY